MFFCIRRKVSNPDIARAAREGCARFEELQDEPRAGAGCGACSDGARKVFGQHAGAAAPQGRARTPNLLTAAPTVDA
jgi:bacterioferritin-associated ferredoxin